MVVLNGIGKSRPLTLSERVDPNTTALVLIDVQNDFCDVSGVCGGIGEDMTSMPAALKCVKDLVAAARAANMVIIFVRASYDPIVLSPVLKEVYDRRPFASGICLEGSPGIDFMPGVEPRDVPNEIVVTKHRYSAWWGTDLDLVLRSNGIKSIVLTGMVTEGCVESTARDAFFRDYYVVVARDAVAAFSEKRHDMSLEILGKSFGRVVSSDEIKGVWSSQPALPRPWQDEQKRRSVLSSTFARLDPRHTAVVMVDVQNDVCAEGGQLTRSGYGIENIRAAQPRMKALVDDARAAGCMVIHVKSEYSALTNRLGLADSEPDVKQKAGASEAPLGAVYAASFEPGSWGGAFAEGLGPVGDEQTVIKHRMSPFVDTRLDLLLRSNGIRSVVVAGVTTNAGVEAAARDACMLDYYVTVAQDAVSAPDQAQHLHRASLENMRNYFAQVLPVEAISAAWPGEDARRGAA